MANNLKETQRIRILLVGLLFVLTFFLVNAQQYAYAFLIYLVLGVLSIFFYTYWSKISNVGDLEGIGNNWVRNSFIGLGLAVATIVIGNFVSFVGVIGFPQISASVVGEIGRWFVVVIFASIFESVFLVNFLTDFFNSKLGLNKWLSLILMAGASSIFHLTAYGLSASGSFLSAFIMFFLFGMLSEYQNDLSGIIVWHSSLNWWLAYLRYSIVLG